MEEPVSIPQDWSDREAVEAWLRTQPRQVSVVIAARAALRVLPLVVEALDTDAATRRAAIVLPVLRASGTFWVAVAGPSQGAEGRARAAAAYAAYAGRATDAADAADAAAFAARAAGADARAAAAAYAAAFAAYFIGAADAAAATAFAARATDAASCAAEAALAADAANDDVHAVALSQLWPQDMPPLAADAWGRLRAHLLDAGEGWQVWVDWYARRLAGGPVDLDLERLFVEIDDDLWVQGPAVVNAEIRRRIAALDDARRADNAAASPADDIAALLGAPSLRIALADFAYDDLSRLMRMVSFPDDLAALADESAEACAADDLSALGADARDLAEDADPNRRQVPREFHRDLERYATEAARGTRRFLPRRLWSLGGALHRWRLDDDLRDSLGRHLAAKLDELCAAHLDLMRTYFAAAIARLRTVDKLGLASDATPEAMIAPLRQALQSLDEDDWSGAPGADEEARAIFASQIEELDAEIKAVGRARDPGRRAELERDVERKAKMTASTLTRMGLRSGEAVLKGANTAATAKSLFPESFDKAIEALKALFPDLPWF